MHVAHEVLGPAGPKGDKGDQGVQGTSGLSAYQVAVANGYVGTEAQWLASLQADVTAHESAADPHSQYQRERVSVTESSTATIAVGALTSVLYLTAGSLVASQEINCSDLPDGCELIIYSTNGITALTISGGTIVGSLTSLAAGAFGRVVRAGTTLLVGA